MNLSKKIFAVVFSLFVLGYVLYTLDWDKAWETIRSLNIIWLLVALSFHLITYLIRTLRFRFLLDNKPRFLSILGATNLYGMYLYLMPVKSGEVTLPLLYKNHMQTPLSQSAAALIAARFLDLIMMAMLLPILLTIQWAQLSPLLRFVIILISLAVILIWIILLFLMEFPEKLHPFITWFENTRFSFLNRLGEIGMRIFTEMCKIYNGKKLLPALLVSAFIWLVVQCTLYSIISSLGIQVTLFQVVVVTLVMIPFTFIPLQGFANLGTYEISVVLAFSIYGVPPDESLNIAVGSHIIYIGFSFILGLIGLVILRISKLIEGPSN